MSPRNHRGLQITPRFSALRETAANAVKGEDAVRDVLDLALKKTYFALKFERRTSPNLNSKNYPINNTNY